ncbi:MAG: cytochrome c, partial [Spirochaetia bacterium]|nr:cytochrome c [Spirochaetia bacterium]
DGPVVPRFPGVFALIKIPGHAGASMDWPDGKIFHMMTVGRGMMKPYAAQISPQDRWAIVHYVRLLQRAAKSETGKQL